jgi:hypothetical protein
MFLSKVRFKKNVQNKIYRYSFKFFFVWNIYTFSDALLAPEDVRIVGGTKFRFEEEQTTFFSVLDKIVVHENFSRSSLENNIAIGFVSELL